MIKLFNFLPVTGAIEAVFSTCLVFFKPSGVNSKAHANNKEIGNPIKTSIMMAVSNQFGRDRGPLIEVIICMISQPVIPYAVATLNTFLLFNSEIIFFKSIDAINS